jgi:YHS domain-containing protein
MINLILFIGAGKIEGEFSMGGTLMTKKLWLAALLIAILGLTIWVTAQVPEKAVDPVCGMSVVKDGAKWTYDYNGATYYFCSEGCKTSFSKEPAKYLAKTAEAMKMGGGMGMMGGQGQGQMQGGMGMMPEMQNMREQLMRMRNEIDMMMQRMRMMAGRMQDGMGPMTGPRQGGRQGGLMDGQMQGMMAGCPMMMEGVDRKVENTKDGVIITMTSKNSETVKKIQDHMAKTKEAMGGKTKEGAAAYACPGCPSSKIK